MERAVKKLLVTVDACSGISRLLPEIKVLEHPFWIANSGILTKVPLIYSFINAFRVHEDNFFFINKKPDETEMEFEYRLKKNLLGGLYHFLICSMKMDANAAFQLISQFAGSIFLQEMRLMEKLGNFRFINPKSNKKSMERYLNFEELTSIEEIKMEYLIANEIHAYANLEDLICKHGTDAAKSELTNVFSIFRCELKQKHYL